MRSFSHLAPALRIHQGDGCLDALGRELERAGSRRAVILCGRSLGRPGGPLGLVREALGARCAGVHAGVRADSPLPAVEDAVAELRRLGADAVVAVGGGSAITTARAAVILLGENGSVHDLCTGRDDSGTLVSPKLAAPKIPVFNVPTTPSNAVVKAGAAVLDPVVGRRLALFDPKARARAVFIEPRLVCETPREVFFSAALNTLALAIEGLMANRGDPLADASLLHALRLTAAQLPRARHADDPDVRADLMAAAVLCGQGTDHTGAGLTVPIGHAIGTRFDVDMGVADAIVQPHVLRFNAEAAPGGIAQVALGLQAAPAPGEPQATTVVEALRALHEALGLPRRLRDVGIPREALAELAAISFDDWFVQRNPRRIESPGDIQAVLEAAW